MRNKIVIVISAIVIIIVAYMLYSYINSDTSSSVDEYIEYEDPQSYSSNIPDDISSSNAWIKFTNSEYYSDDQEYVFKSTDDRIISEYYDDNYYVYIEYVFGEVIIDVYDSESMSVIDRFE